MGPPGKAGLEGGLGPVGNTGPRGITVQGKAVSELQSCKHLSVQCLWDADSKQDK